MSEPFDRNDDGGQSRIPDEEERLADLTDELHDLAVWSNGIRLSDDEAGTIWAAVMNARHRRPCGWLIRLTDGIDRTIARIERHTAVRVKL